MTVASPAAVRRLGCRGEDKDPPAFLIFPRSTTRPGGMSKGEDKDWPDPYLTDSHYPGRRIPRPRRPRRAKSTGPAGAPGHVRLLAAALFFTVIVWFDLKATPRLRPSFEDYAGKHQVVRHPRGADGSLD